MTAVLPTFMGYRSAEDLIRLGKDYDGGYLVSRKDVEASAALVSLGVNDDWSFESDFVTLHDVPVTAYDASVNARVFLTRAVESLARIDRPAQLVYWLRTYRSYTSFFRGSRRHVERFVEAGRDERSVSLDDVVRAAPDGALFLKIDIEGSEYRLLDDLVRHAGRTSGLVIEMHDCDLHLDRIRSFLEDYPLRLVHVHANNFAPVHPDTGLPRVLELTFSRHGSLARSCTLPHPLDMPNDRYRPDVLLTVAGSS